MRCYGDFILIAYLGHCSKHVGRFVMETILLPNSTCSLEICKDIPLFGSCMLNNSRGSKRILYLLPLQMTSIFLKNNKFPINIDSIHFYMTLATFPKPFKNPLTFIFFTHLFVTYTFLYFFVYCSVKSFRKLYIVSCKYI